MFVGNIHICVSYVFVVFACSGQGSQGASSGCDEDRHRAGLRRWCVRPNDGVDSTAFEFGEEISLKFFFVSRRGGRVWGGGGYVAGVRVLPGPYDSTALS